MDDSCRFLVLTTDGLYRSLEDSTGTNHVNADIVSMVAAEFQVQSTLNGVAQAVVDRVVRIHHDTYMTGSEHRKSLCHYRDDITLLVRNFNYQLPNSIQSPTNINKVNPVSVPFYQPRKQSAPTVLIPEVNASLTNPLHVEVKPESPQQSVTRLLLSGVHHTNFQQTGTSTIASSITSNISNYTSTNESTEDSGEQQRFKAKVNNKLELDKDGKIAPYVDFSDFYQAIAELSEAQRESLDAKTQPQSSYDPIEEEAEPPAVEPQAVASDV